MDRRTSQRVQHWSLKHGFSRIREQMDWFGLCTIIDHNSIKTRALVISISGKWLVPFEGWISGMPDMRRRLWRAFAVCNNGLTSRLYVAREGYSHGKSDEILPQKGLRFRVLRGDNMQGVLALPHRRTEALNIHWTS